MRRILAFIFALAFVISIGTWAIQPPKGFDGDLWRSTVALYGTTQGASQFLCTAEVIGKIPSGYRLLSAGHCVQIPPDDTVFSVASDIGSPRTQVSIVNVRYDDAFDFSTFDLDTAEVFPIMTLGDETSVSVDDRVIVPSFAGGITKQISHGLVSSRTANGVFLVQADAAPGASGAAVLSEKTHKVIGIVTEGFNVGGYVGFGVEPISRYFEFLKQPRQKHPAPAEIGEIE